MSSVFCQLGTLRVANGLLEHLEVHPRERREVVAAAVDVGVGSFAAIERCIGARRYIPNGKRVVEARQIDRGRAETRPILVTAA